MDYKSIITKSLLSTLNNAVIASGGKEISARCPICGDSQSDKSKRSFYISIDEDKPLMFICFRANCQAKGIVTPELLQSWGNNDIDAGIALNKYNKQILALPQNRKLKDRETYYLNNIISDDDNLNKSKLDYINNRLGLDLSYDDLLKLKINTSIISLLKSNNIKELTRHPNVVRELDKHFIGFISQDNAFINMRNIHIGNKEMYLKKRYENYNIFNKVDNSHKFYIIPTNINLNSLEPIKIHISEGPIDILSIYLNMDKDRNNSIFCSINGFGYTAMIKFFIVTLKLINIEFHMYLDNDVQLYKMKKSEKILHNLNNIPLYYHFNIYENEKDFGVPRDRIKENIKRIL